MIDASEAKVERARLHLELLIADRCSSCMRGGESER